MSSSSGTDANLDIKPKPPAPLYPDVPWWAVLVASIVFAFLGIIIGVKMGAFPSVPGGIAKVGGIAALAVDTIAYMPHILLLFGVLADMFTLDGVWSIPSLVGLLSIFANGAFEYFWKGIDELFETAKKVGAKVSGEPTTTPPPASSSPAAQSGSGRGQKGGKLFESYSNATGCEVQGFGQFNSPYAPQTLVVTATVFSYYVIDLIRNRGWINSIAGILAFLLLYVAEVVIIDTTTDGVGCKVIGSKVVTSSLGQGIRAFFEGLLFGGVSYGIVQTYAPNRLPSATISPFPVKTVDDLSMGPDGRMYDENGFPYVCMSSGQCYPDLSKAEDRAAFASAAGELASSLGSDCPGVNAGCGNA